MFEKLFSHLSLLCTPELPVMARKLGTTVGLKCSPAVASWTWLFLKSNDWFLFLCYSDQPEPIVTQR